MTLLLLGLMPEADSYIFINDFRCLFYENKFYGLKIYIFGDKLVFYCFFYERSLLWYRNRPDS